MKNKAGLGRGLSALIKPTEAPMEVGRPVGSGPERIPVEAIEANPFQPRHYFDADALAELAASIKEHGMIQPVTVRLLGESRYQLIAGERRWQASKLAGLPDVPAYVREATEQQMLEIAIIENLQREDLNAIEVALSFQRLISECKLRQEDLADRVGKKRSTVTNFLRLLKLPPDAQSRLSEGRISMGHAKAMLGLTHTDHQLNLLQIILERDLSVRQTEEMVRVMTEKASLRPSAPKKANPLTAELASVQKQLASRFGTKVALRQRNASSGEISMPYTSIEELNRLLEILL